MPVSDITQEPKTMSRYDIVGKWSESLRHFVTHVALLDEDKSSLKSGDEASAVHMRPPLKREDKITVNVGGCIPLTNDERKQVETWIEKVNDESRGYHWPDQYVIHPPWKDEYDRNTGIRRYRRYSCAGFVLDSHLHININLLDINENVLPSVDRGTIIKAYPNVEKHPDLLIKWGLKGDGPWKVVLAGYVLHALNRSTDNIRNAPYKANNGDEKF